MAKQPDLTKAELLALDSIVWTETLPGGCKLIVPTVWKPKGRNPTLERGILAFAEPRARG